LAYALGIDVIVTFGEAAGAATVAIFPELIPVYKLEFQHMATWMTIADVPGTADLESGMWTDSPATILHTVERISSLSMGGNPQ
jgi:hypothetical protein